MKNIITIEYCTSWNYVPRAVSLTEKLLNEFKDGLAEVTIVPSSGGVFEVALNGKLLFSKKELERFPNDGEVESKLRDEI